jgi:hypothetical protein
MTRQERFQDKANALAGLGLAVAGTLALCLFAWLLVTPDRGGSPPGPRSPYITLCLLPR